LTPLAILEEKNLSTPRANNFNRLDALSQTYKVGPFTHAYRMLCNSCRSKTVFSFQKAFRNWVMFLQLRTAGCAS